jgi:hypothetical protein
MLRCAWKDAKAALESLAAIFNRPGPDKPDHLQS